MSNKLVEAKQIPNYLLEKRSSPVFPILASIALFVLLTSKFDYLIAQQIKERDKGCVVCGETDRSKWDASHIDHRRGKRYQSLDNGETRCRKCHFDYHLENLFAPEKIGMTRDGNLASLCYIWDRMTQDERSEQMAILPPEVKSLIAHHQRQKLQQIAG